MSTNVFLRRLHNFALDMDWALKAVIPKRQWPQVRYAQKRAITAEEHRKIVEREGNAERRSFYELCWALGGSQGDIAHLKAEDINWQDRLLSYERKKPQIMKWHIRSTERGKYLKGEWTENLHEATAGLPNGLAISSIVRLPCRIASIRLLPRNLSIRLFQRTEGW